MWHSTSPPCLQLQAFSLFVFCQTIHVPTPNLYAPRQPVPNRSVGDFLLPYEDCFYLTSKCFLKECQEIQLKYQSFGPEATIESPSSILKPLDFVRLHDCSEVSDDFLDGLGPSLSKLKLERCSSKVVKKVLQSGIEVQTLVSEGISSFSMRDFSDVRGLKNLELIGCEEFNPEAGDSAKKFAIERLLIAACHFVENSVLSISFFPNLEVLNLPGNEIGNSWLDQLS